MPLFALVLLTAAVAEAAVVPKWGAPAAIAAGVSPSLYATENASYVVFCDPSSSSSSYSRLMFTRTTAPGVWTRAAEIGGGCDCAETAIAGVGDRLFVAAAGRRLGVLDAFFVESGDGGRSWKSALWLEHNPDGVPRSSVRIGVTPPPAEAVWVATLRGPPGAANVSYWSRGADGWLSEQIAPASRDELAFTLSVAVPAKSLGSSACSALYLASVSLARGENAVVRISQCAQPVRWTFAAQQPVHPIVVATGDFLALLALDKLSQLHGWQFVSGAWNDVGVLTSSPMPIYPAVAVQQDTTLAILAPTGISCPSVLNSWTLLPQTSWTAGGFAGCPSGDLPCINSHPRVEFQGATPLIGTVFTDNNSTIYHNYCTF